MSRPVAESHGHRSGRLQEELAHSDPLVVVTKATDDFAPNAGDATATGCEGMVGYDTQDGPSPAIGSRRGGLLRRAPRRAPRRAGFLQVTALLERLHSGRLCAPLTYMS